MLAIMFLFCEWRSINSLISLGICSTQKLSKWTISFLLQNKVIQCAPTSAYSPRFIIYAPSFIFSMELHSGKLFFRKTPLILVHFDNTLVFQSLFKDEAELKIPLFFIFIWSRGRRTTWTSSYNSFSFFIPWTSSYNSFSC